VPNDRLADIYLFMLYLCWELDLAGPSKTV